MTAEKVESTGGLELLAWLETNWKKLAIGAGVALVAAIVWWLNNHLGEERELEASRALTELRAGADVRSGGQVKPEDYQRIQSEFGGTAASRQALLLQAGALFDAGRYEEAHKAFTKFTQENPRSPLLPQAMLGVAASLEALKRPDEAADMYRGVANRFPNDAVNAPAQLALGRLLEAKGQFDQAHKIYQEMARNIGRSAWGTEFLRRQDELLRRHPELAVTNAPAAAVVPAPPVPAPAPAPAAEKK